MLEPWIVFPVIVAPLAVTKVPTVPLILFPVTVAPDTTVVKTPLA